MYQSLVHDQVRILLFATRKTRQGLKALTKELPLRRKDPLMYKLVAVPIVLLNQMRKYKTWREYAMIWMQK